MCVGKCMYMEVYAACVLFVKLAHLSCFKTSHKVCVVIYIHVHYMYYTHVHVL